VLISEIPVQKIREAIGDDTELISLVVDQNKSVVDSQREVINWEAYDRAKVYHYSVVSLAPGSYDFRVVIRNLETGASALAAGTAIVLERKEKRLQLFPPLLLRPEKAVLYLRASLGENASRGQDVPSLADVFTIDPNEYTPYVEKTLYQGSEVWTLIRCAFAAGSGGATNLALFFVDQTTGEKVALPLTIESETENDNVRTYLAHFWIPTLEADEYTLVLVGENPTSGESSIIGCDYVVQ
jgi:hypothetical protein